MVQRDTITSTHAPAAIGPYSQAIAAGGLLYCSGQIPLDPASSRIAGEGADAQAERCLANLEAICQEAGTTLSRAVKTTIYLISMADFTRVNEVYAGWFSDDTPPARVSVGVAELPMGARVEIDAIILLK